AKAIATRSAMGAVGVNYMQYQAGQAMREAARNEGQGLAALGAGAGAGLGIGQALSQAMAAGMQQPVPQPPSSAAPTKAQIRQALTNLDIRFANGEINEETYNRLRENLSKALESAAE
ncbi:MAG: hypothetical protein RML84_10230, partial [Anaerolineae bacterium]|nr:hypothetical protein [Anaerolineae bacterium]